MDNNEYRAWQAGEGSDDCEYSDAELSQFSIQALENMLHTDLLPALTIALWETVRDLISYERRHKLIVLASEAAKAGDDGIFTIPLMEEVAYVYAISASAQNAIHDFTLATIKDELIEALERSL